jgi:hypothetical protein
MLESALLVMGVNQRFASAVRSSARAERPATSEAWSFSRGFLEPATFAAAS